MAVSGNPSSFRNWKCVFLLLFSAVFSTFAADQSVSIAYWNLQGGLIDGSLIGETVAHLNAQLADHTFAALPMTHEELQAAVADRKIDFVITDPAVYLELEAQYGAARIASAQTICGDRTCALLGGVVFCLAENGELRSAADLKNKTIATAHKAALGSWLSVLRELREEGIDPERDLQEVVVTKSERASVEAVLQGKAFAAALRTGTLEHLAAEGVIDLAELTVLNFSRIYGADPSQQIPMLASTSLYPEWCLAACDRVSDRLIRDVATAVLTTPGREHSNPGGPRHAG